MAIVVDHAPVVCRSRFRLLDVSDREAPFYSWQTNILAAIGVVGFEFAYTVEQIIRVACHRHAQSSVSNVTMKSFTGW